MGPKPAQLFSKARTSAASKAPLASSAGQPPSSSLSFGRLPDLDHDHPDNQHPGAVPSGGSSAAAFSNIQTHASTPRLSTVDNGLDATFLRTTTTSSSPGGHTDGPLPFLSCAHARASPRARAGADACTNLRSVLDPSIGARPLHRCSPFCWLTSRPPLAWILAHHRTTAVFRPSKTYTAFSPPIRGSSVLPRGVILALYPPATR